MLVTEIGVTGDIIVNTSNFIGSSSGGNQYFFDGVIDDINIYNRALSDSEISDLYNEGNYLEREALLALYNSTDGANWTDNTNWGTGADLSTWVWHNNEWRPGHRSGFGRK